MKQLNFDNLYTLAQYLNRVIITEARQEQLMMEGMRHKRAFGTYAIMVQI